MESAVPSVGSKLPATSAPSITVFSLVNIRSLLHKADDVIEMFNDHPFDFHISLIQSWRDAESVCIHLLRAGSYQVVGRVHLRMLSHSLSTTVMLLLMPR
jgi:hypothetical protein